MAQYLLEFEDLANHIVGLPPSFLLSCFVSGLTSEIRREVQAHQPLILVQAARLACLQEEKLLDVPTPLRKLGPLSLPSVPPHQSLPQPQPTVLQPQLRTASLPLLLPLSGRPPSPPLKRLSPDEIASRRE